jgi:hypothetical protein
LGTSGFLIFLGLHGNKKRSLPREGKRPFLSDKSYLGLGGNQVEGRAGFIDKSEGQHPLFFEVGFVDLP